MHILKVVSVGEDALRNMKLSPFDRTIYELANGNGNGGGGGAEGRGGGRGTVTLLCDILKTLRPPSLIPPEENLDSPLYIWQKCW